MSDHKLPVLQEFRLFIWGGYKVLSSSGNWFLIPIQIPFFRYKHCQFRKGHLAGKGDKKQGRGSEL
jgi:hypothetical protein